MGLVRFIPKRERCLLPIMNEHGLKARSGRSDRTTVRAGISNDMLKESPSIVRYSFYATYTIVHTQTHRRTGAEAVCKGYTLRNRQQVNGHTDTSDDVLRW